MKSPSISSFSDDQSVDRYIIATKPERHSISRWRIIWFSMAPVLFVVQNSIGLKLNRTSRPTAFAVPDCRPHLNRMSYYAAVVGLYSISQSSIFSNSLFMALGASFSLL
eukprot:Selendium_serpulae@DN1683_c0_g1_i1.p1